MTGSNDPTPRKEEEKNIEREIRSQRKFSLAEAIGRLGGSDLMKGASPVPRKRQAELAIEQYLERNLIDAEGALGSVLTRRVRDSDILLQKRYNEPLKAVAEVIERILGSDERLHRFVHEVDAEWGRMYRERPHFQQQAGVADPEDPYTFASVRDSLTHLLGVLRDFKGGDSVSS
jgi:hypothetical protein